MLMILLEMCTQLRISNNGEGNNIYSTYLKMFFTACIALVSNSGAISVSQSTPQLSPLLGHWEADERSIWGVDCAFSTFRNKTHVISFFPFVHYLAKKHKKSRLTTENRKKMPPKALHALFLPKIHGNVHSADLGHDSIVNCDVTDLSDQSLTYNFQHS